MIQFKIHPTIWYLCLLWFLCSCEQEYETIENARVAANFTPAIAEIAQVETSPAESWSNATTRVDNNQWTNNDIIGIIALDIDGSPITADGFRQYEPSIAGTHTQLIPVRDDELADQTIYFPTNGDEVTFTAFAPYQVSENNTVTYELNSQSTTSNAMESLDFIFHRGQKVYSQSSPIVALNFRHKLSRVVINLTRGSGYDASLAGTEAEIQGVYTSVSCDVRTGGISALGDGNINPYRSTTADGEVTFQAIVAPQEASSTPSAEDRTVAFSVGGQEYTQEIPQDWETGKSYTYNFTLDASGITLTGSTVVSWGAGTVAWNGNYYLRIDQKELSLSSAGSTTNKLIMVSNYASNPVITFRESEDPNSNIITTWLTTPTLTRTTSGTEHTYTLTYTSTANTIDRSTPRVGYIHIAAATITTVVKVTQAGSIEPESNCYILPPGGNTIYIPVSRANTFAAGTIGDNTNFSWELVWTDVTGNGTDGTPHVDAAIADVSNEGTRGPTGYLAITSGSKEGNAVIAVTVGGEADRIKWSWHIWVTKYNPTAMAKTYTNTNGVTNIFMDRNMGALNGTNSLTPIMGTPESLGLLYQWGRKDPFPASASATANTQKTFYTSSGSTTPAANTANTNGTGVSIATSIQNPLIFYCYNDSDADWCSDTTDSNTRWGFSPYIKSLYDPCPDGWRVPLKDAWLGHTLDNLTYSATHLGMYHAETGWYPYAGYRHLSAGNYGRTGERIGIWYASAGVRGEYMMFFSTNSVVLQNTESRITGQSIRCVKA